MCTLFRLLQLHKILRHADGSCELVHSTIWILSQQIVREKKLDSEYVCLPFKLALGVKRTLTEPLHVDIGMTDRVPEFMCTYETLKVFRQITI